MCMSESSFSVAITCVSVAPSGRSHVLYEVCDEGKQDVRLAHSLFKKKKERMGRLVNHHRHGDDEREKR